MCTRKHCPPQWVSVAKAWQMLAQTSELHTRNSTHAACDMRHRAAMGAHIQSPQPSLKLTRVTRSSDNPGIPATKLWHHGSTDSPCGSRCGRQRALAARRHAQHGRARPVWHHGRSDAPCGSRRGQQRVLKALWHAQHGRARAQPAHIAQLPAGRHLVVAAAVAHGAHVARLDQDAAEGLDLRCTRTASQVMPLRS